jgi:signal transduction histidine kinase/ActR/RegA family two-component response regulator
MSVRLSITNELQPILEESLWIAAGDGGTALGLLYVAGADQGALEIAAVVGIDRALVDAVPHLRAGGGASGTAFQERRRVIIEDTETDPGSADFREEARRAGYRSVHSTPLITRTGAAVGVLSIHCPISRRPSDRDLHRADLSARQVADFLENARLYAQLREAERSKNEFLATLAHELRNPLAPIRNAVQILHLKSVPSPEVQWALDVVDRQMELMTRLVDDLLDVARITSHKLELRREPVELTEVFRVAVETSRPLIEASGLEFVVSHPREPLFLDGDLGRLSQVVSNLLNNSAKYTERGGRIELAAERQGGEVVITVRDTGIGIPGDMLPRIFEIFTQVQRSSEHPMGLGIGLTLVKRLVEMHNGTIEAASAGPGQGSQFTIRLPAVLEAKAALRRAAQGPSPVRSGAPQRILIVDDNMDAAASLGLLLRLTGNEIRTAHDGLEALRVAEEFLPDVIVLDIGLPKMDGYEVADRIRRAAWGRDMVLIAATGWGQEADRHRSRESGIDHHLVKPVDPAALIHLLVSIDDPTVSSRKDRTGVLVS